MNNVFVNFRVALCFHDSLGYLKTAMKDDDKLWRGKGGTDPRRHRSHRVILTISQNVAKPQSITLGVLY